jgi:hypothetical protein
MISVQRRAFLTAIGELTIAQYRLNKLVQNHTANGSVALSARNEKAFFLFYLGLKPLKLAPMLRPSSPLSSKFTSISACILIHSVRKLGTFHPLEEFLPLQSVFQHLLRPDFP